MFGPRRGQVAGGWRKCIVGEADVVATYKLNHGRGEQSVN